MKLSIVTTIVMLSCYSLALPLVASKNLSFLLKFKKEKNPELAAPAPVFLSRVNKGLVNAGVVGATPKKAPPYSLDPPEKPKTDNSKNWKTPAKVAAGAGAAAVAIVPPTVVGLNHEVDTGTDNSSTTN